MVVHIFNKDISYDSKLSESKISHFGVTVKYSNSVLKCLSFIIIPLLSYIQIKVLIYDIELLDLFGNSEGTKLLRYEQSFLVHLSRRLKCTIVIMRCPSVRPSLTFHIFDFSENAERNSTKLDRKQDRNVLYQVCVFRADQRNKMATLASDLLRHFPLLL